MRHLKIYENHNSVDDFFPKEALTYKPKNLYHLTPARSISSILNEGLLIRYSKQHKFDQGVYLTHDLHVARQYSYLNGPMIEYYIIEIPFENLEEEHMKPDDWEMFDIIDDEWDELRNYFNIKRTLGNEELIWKSLNYKHSLYISDQLLYTKNVSPDKFTNVYPEYKAKKS